MERDLETSILETLSQRWQRCGLHEGDTVLVHSSLKRLLNILKEAFAVPASPKLVYDSLKLALGENGTLILPLYNFDFPKTRFFDIRNTPSQMGALTEIGRNSENSIRTGHPIYSFSVHGKHSGEFKGIDNVSGYGADSPFAILKKLGGKIAILGLTDQDSMTSYHFVEEQNAVDYRYFKNFSGDYIDQEGNKSEKTYSLYVRDIDRGVVTDVNRMMDRLWTDGLYQGERPDEGYGMRSIDFNAFYQATDQVIKNGDAINYLYSIEISNG